MNLFDCMLTNGIYRKYRKKETLESDEPIGYIGLVDIQNRSFKLDKIKSLRTKQLKFDPVTIK